MPPTPRCPGGVSPGSTIPACRARWRYCGACPPHRHHQHRRPLGRHRRAARRLSAVLLVRAAHPRQAVVTAAGAGRRGRDLGPTAARGRAGPGHRARRTGGARLGQRPRRRGRRPRRPDAPTSRSPTGRARARNGWLRAGLWRAAARAPRRSSSGHHRRRLLPAVGAGGAGRQPRGCAAARSRGCRGRSRSRSTRRSSRTAGGAVAPTGDPPTIAMTLVAALLGVGVHVLTSLSRPRGGQPSRRRHLPLRLALRFGAPRLLGPGDRVLRAASWRSRVTSARARSAVSSDPAGAR